MAQAQTYLFNYERFGGYIRIPTFSLTNGAISSLNTSEGFQFNITLSRYRVQFANISIPISRFGWTWNYQPPLNQELNVSEYDFVNATHAINNSVVLVHRPENVVGSYAVYSNFSGNQYGTGKVLHLYRPLLIDANGNRLWGNLNVTNGILNISCNQTWLESAAYPVIVDPTFGYESVGGTGVTYDSGYTYATKYSLSESASITDIRVYCNNAYGTYDARVGLYDGSPTNRDAWSDEFVITSTPAWCIGSVSVSEVAGDYWLAVGSFHSGLRLYYDSGDTGQSHVGNGLGPDPWSDSSSQDRKYSIYATYTASEQNIIVDYVIYGNATATLTTQKNLYRVTSITTTATITLFGIRGVIRVTSVTIGSSDGLSTVKTITRVSGESTSVTTISSSSKSITAVIAELLETAASTAGLTIQKNIFAVLLESVGAEALLVVVKHLATTIFDLAETASITGVLYTVLPVIPLTAEEALGAAIAFVMVFFSVAIGFVVVYARRRSD